MRYDRIAQNYRELKVCNVDSSVVSPLKHSSNILYYGTALRVYGLKTQ